MIANIISLLLFSVCFAVRYYPLYVFGFLSTSHNTDTLWLVIRLCPSFSLSRRHLKVKASTISPATWMLWFSNTIHSRFSAVRLIRHTADWESWPTRGLYVHMVTAVFSCTYSQKLLKLLFLYNLYLINIYCSC